MLLSLHVLPTPLVFFKALRCRWVKGVLIPAGKPQGWSRAVWGCWGGCWLLQVPGVCARSGCPSWQGQLAPCPLRHRNHPQPAGSLWPWGAVAAGGSRAVPRENTTPEEVPASPPAGAIGASAGVAQTAKRAPCPVPPPEPGEGLGWSCAAPEPGEGQQGSRRGAARAGRRGAGARQRRGAARAGAGQCQRLRPAMERRGTLLCSSCGGRGWEQTS